MDVPEGTHDLQGPLEEISKMDTANPDFNENQNLITYDQSNTYTIDPQSGEGYENQLIVNGEVVEHNQSETSIEENVEGKVAIVENPSELFPVESVDQVIVTTLSEVIPSENESTITSCAMQSNIISISETKIEDTTLKVQEESLTSNSVLDESLPSFIGEIDESVSLPPAEPLVLEQETITVVEEIVTEGDDKVADEEATQGSTGKDEIIAKNEILQENENQTTTENAAIVEDSITVNEIDLTETAQTEIITSSDSNIQYTVLPPGENSVYQEDGTLVVEYPLDTTDLSQSHTEDMRELDESQKTGDSSSKIDDQEGNSIEMVEAPSEDEISPPNVGITSVKIEDVVIVKKTEDSNKTTPKRRGRKATGNIPPHIIGSPIDNPSQDINGKGLKPRLGVKIPYRKLASQIVSTTELQNHIVERARLKEEARSEADKSSLFTKKLTHRLAQTLLPRIEQSKTRSEVKETSERDVQLIGNILSSVPRNTSGNSSDQKPSNSFEFVEQIVNDETSASETISDEVGQMELMVPTTGSIEHAEIIFAENLQNTSNIENNSDLIAILEGDGEESSPLMNVPNIVEIIDTSENASEIKAIEKEISLSEQKSSPPAAPQVKEKKFFKSGESRVSDVSKEKKKEVSKTKSSLISSTPQAKISSIKKEDPDKSNIFDIENAASSKIAAKSAEIKKNAAVDQEKSALIKGKTSGSVVEVEPQLKPAMVLKTYTRKRKSNDVATPEPAKKPLIVPTTPSQPDPKIDCVTPNPPDVYITKSSRVIKKKVIWDPDEAMPSVRSQSKILSKIETTAKATPTSKQTPKSAEKKFPEKEKLSDQKKVGKINQDDKEKKVNIEKQSMKKSEKIEVAKKPTTKSPVLVKTTQAKVVITSSMKISPNKSPKKSSKRLSEIDRLLMDEGAVNMLYDINNSDDQKRRVSGRTSSAPTDKALNQKELLNRTLEIKNELTQGTIVDSSTTKTLRKKEGPSPMKKDKEMKEPSAIARKMSKDSTKSSTHSPPPSPAAFTPAEASRIIRRHSSSSFSSNEGVVQDESSDTSGVKEKERPTRKKEVPVEKSSKPVDNVVTQEEQNIIKSTKKRPLTTDTTPKKKLRRDEPVVANGEQSKPVEITVKSEPGNIIGATKTDPTKAFTVVKMNKHYMINLTYFGGENYLTCQILRDLVVTLKELERTRNCSVVSINSQGPSFCLGIDYKELVESDEAKRSKKISELSSGIRELLTCLLNFSKIIVAGVKGDCVGLGVTMLPLFDMIVATDTANFCTPYAKVGCPPEGGFLLSIPYQSNHGLASELLYTAHRMNADEAQRRGLVTKLFWPEKFDSEFKALLSHISNLSKPALMVTKRQLRQTNQKSAETEIVNNCKILRKYWASEECQRDFVNYNALTFDIDQ